MLYFYSLFSPILFRLVIIKATRRHIVKQKGGIYMKRCTSILRKLKGFTPPVYIGFLIAVVCSILVSEALSSAIYKLCDKNTEFGILQEQAKSAVNDSDQLLATASNITISDDNIFVTFEENKTRVQAIYDKDFQLVTVTKDYISPMFYAILAGIVCFILIIPIITIVNILVVYLIITIAEYLLGKVKAVFSL